ncbi:alpha/beta hydrolase [Ornithinimicrobium sp. Y1847]|uniref:alpha/beta hydrolase n=1 Tax=Ornithinimicrobium sp. Y1847 TaxID=3405419 RepID=UPI003B67E82A
MTRRRRRGAGRALRGVGLAVLVVGVVVTLIWSLQRQLMYFPARSDPGSVANIATGGRDLTLRTADGLELGAWLLPPDEQADSGYAVVMAPGNGGHRGGRLGLGEQLAEQGLAVLLLDYRGYGGNPGSPTREGLAQDADAAVEALAEQGYGLDRIVYLGESLGTGVVAELAERHTPAAVVLRSPYTTFADVAKVHYPWLPVGALLRDDYDVVGPLSRTQVPVSVVYGSVDGVVPPELSERVAREVAVLHEEVVLDGVDHNDSPMFGEPVVRAVVDAVASVSDGIP